MATFLLTGIFKDESEDSLAKNVTKFLTVDSSLPISHLHTKSYLCSRLLMSWQDYLDYSDKGRFTHELIPVIFIELRTLSSPVTSFLTRRGPFGAYPHKIHRSDSLNCKCAQATSFHDYYNYPFIQFWHIRWPLLPSNIWEENVFLVKPYL